MDISNLPPDPEGMNDDRAKWAQAALYTFMEETGQTDSVEAIGDLVTDLMHLADRFDMDPRSMLSKAEDCYSEETTPEDDND